MKSHPEQIGDDGDIIEFRSAAKYSGTGWFYVDVTGDYRYVARACSSIPTGVVVLLKQSYRYSGPSGLPPAQVCLVDDPLQVVLDLVIKLQGATLWQSPVSIGDVLDSIYGGSLRPLDEPVGEVNTPAPAPAPKPCHVESLPQPNRHQQIPDSVLAAALDRGERAVRRSLRTWPDGKQLQHRVLLDLTPPRVEWFWTTTTED